MNDLNLCQSHNSPAVLPSASADGCPQEVPDDKDFQWYVMRSTYCREMKARELLETDGFECYVPVRTVRIERGGKLITKVVPVVHNLVFVFSSRALITPWKRTHEIGASLRYNIDRSTGKPMVVNKKVMDDFIRVTREADDILFLDNPEVVVAKGQRVEIIVGPFKGVQGRVLRIRRDRRVVVSIEGIVAAAMASMPQSHFRLLED